MAQGAPIDVTEPAAADKLAEDSRKRAVISSDPPSYARVMQLSSQARPAKLRKTNGGGLEDRLPSGLVPPSGVPFLQSSSM